MQIITWGPAEKTIGVTDSKESINASKATRLLVKRLSDEVTIK
jgi:hypothetical protein